MTRPGAGMSPSEAWQRGLARRPCLRHDGPVDTYSDRPLLDKLGVRPEHRVSVLGFDPDDEDFADSLRERGADVSRRVRQGSNLIFLRATGPRDLERLGRLERWLEQDGAIWVVYPKGRKDIRETDVIAAGLAVKLVDNKIVRFSEVDTAIRLVIPVARR